jgi:hypothetical protein
VTLAAVSTPEIQSDDTSTSTAVAASFIALAAILLMVGGIFQAIQALVALFNDTFYVVGPKYIFQFDLTTWGWVHLILGVLLAVVGVFLLMGAGWARWTAVILAGLSAVANFAWLPHYPLWSVLVIALDIMVIWALTARGGDYQRAL